MYFNDNPLINTKNCLLAKQEMTSVVAAEKRLKCIHLESENYTETKALRLRFGYKNCEKLKAIPKAFHKSGK